MITIRKFLLSASLITLCANGILRGQTTLDAVISAPKGAPTIPVRNGYFNVYTGNLHLEIPITSTPQRGMGPQGVKLVYDSGGFWLSNSQFPGDNPVISPHDNETFWQLSGFSGLPASGSATPMNVQEQGCGGGWYGSIQIYNFWEFTDTSGTSHLFTPGTTFTQNCASATGTPEYPNGYGNLTAGGFATDGSGYYISITNGNEPQVYYPDGSDNSINPNGNEAYFYTDNNVGTSTCNNTMGFDAQPYVAAPSATCQMVYQGFNGSSSKSTYTLVWQYIPVCTAFDANLSAPIQAYDYCGGIWALESITLPDRVSTYSFQYDTGTTPGHYGQMTAMTLPTGGTVGYSYYPPTGNGGSDPSDGRGDVKSITDNGGITSFSRTFSTYTNFYNLAVPQFLTAAITYPPHIIDPLKPTVLATDETIFTTAQLPPSGNVTPTTMTQQDYLTGVLTKTTNWDTTVVGIPSFVQTTWNQTGATDKIQYMYALGDVVSRADEYVNGSLYRTKTVQYQQDTSAIKYVSQFHMVNYPISTQVLDGNGIPVAQESRTYDEYGASYCNVTPPGVGTIPMLTNIMGALAHDDTDNGSSYWARGNPTTITTGTTAGSMATVHKCYDTLGNVTEAVDANSKPTAFSNIDNYSDTNCITSSSPTYTFATLITDALGYQTKKAYNSCLGAVTKSQDANDLAANRSGTQQTYDLDGRPLCTTFADTGSSCMGYPAPNTITQGVALNATQSHSTTTTLNSFGNAASIVDNSSDSEVDKTYDGAGRLSTVSNPYTVGSTSANGVTAYAYDGFGRLLAQLQADGSSELLWSYTGTTVDAYDEVKVHRQMQTDVMGRLVGTLELGTAAAPLNYETDYSYNVLNNLLQVDQWGGPKSTAGERQRTFTYDSMSRLLCASNPENSSNNCPSVEPANGSAGLPTGTVRYIYDNNGNVFTRTDARGITTTSHYDALNRVMSKTYSDGVTPSANFTYDTSPVTGNANTIGRLTSESTSVGSRTWTQRQPYLYDPMGRLKGELQCTPGNCSGTANSLQYNYDLAGDMTTSTNGVANPGVQITNVYDGAARLMTVTSTWSDSEHPPTLFHATAGSTAACGLTSVPAYDAANQLQYAQIAVNAQSQAAFSTTRCYDNRLRPTSETDASLQSAPGMPASTAVTVSGAEQSIGGTGTATQATGAISLSYSGAQVIGARPLYLGNSITLPDGYHVSFVATANSAVVVANALAAVLNTVSSPVTAVVTSGGTARAASVVLTTKATGADQNGAITLSLVTTQVKAAPASLSGGTGTTYDTGAITANINGTAVSVGYGQTSTPQSVAAALATAISGAGAGVTATAASAVVTVTAIQAGTAANGWAVTLSSATDQPKFFSSPSFTGTSGTLGGGVAGLPAGILYNYSIPAPGAPTTGYDAHGNLLSYSDCVANMPSSSCITGTWALTYDSLNRTHSGIASAGPWNGLSLVWGYDAFGNRTAQTVGGNPPPNAPLPQSQTLSYTSGNNNRIDNFGPSGYDPAGNVTYDLVNTYLYDGEGRVCAVAYPSGTTTAYEQYIYDAEGRRVAKGSIGSLSCNVSNSGSGPSNGYAQTGSYVLGQSGEHISELDAAGNFLRSHVYANGRLLATYTNNTTEFAFNDWLGTKRVVANANDAPPSTCVNLPFGDALSCSNSASLNGHHFTGQIHDQTSGNDYFGARYYSNYTGRFLSPDWSSDPDAVPYADFTNPQSLNLYGYVDNNPLSYRDPTGHVDEGCTSSGAPDDNGTIVVTVNCAQLPPETFDLLQQTPNYTPIPAMESGLKAGPLPAVLPQLKGPEVPQVGPATNNPKQDYCLRQALKGAAKDITGLSLIDDLATALTTGNLSQFATPGYAAQGVQQGASAVAGSMAARTAIRAALREEAVKVSTKAVGKTATAIGKGAGYIGLGLTANSAYEAYKECMAQ
jgi:RHS repeat-associated protein